MLKFTYASMLILLAVPAVRAQHVNHYSYYPNYKPVQYYQHQHYGHQYQHQYQEHYYPAQKVIAQEIAVAPLIVTVPVDSKAVPAHAYGSPYYYSVSQAYQEKAYLRELLREELRNLVSGGQATNKVQTAPAPTPVPSPSPSQVTIDDVTPPDLQQKILAAYNGRGSCLNCHGANGPAQGPKGLDGKVREFRLVADDGRGGNVLLKQSSDKRWKIYGMSSAGVMPPAAANDAAKAMEPTHLPAMLQYAAIKD